MYTVGQPRCRDAPLRILQTQERPARARRPSFFPKRSFEETGSQAGAWERDQNEGFCDFDPVMARCGTSCCSQLLALTQPGLARRRAAGRAVSENALRGACEFYTHTRTRAYRGMHPFPPSEGIGGGPKERRSLASSHRAPPSARQLQLAEGVEFLGEYANFDWSEAPFGGGGRGSKWGAAVGRDGLRVLRWLSTIKNAHLNERAGDSERANSRRPAAICPLPTLPRLAKYSTDIKSLNDSELRSALPLLCHAATWSEMNGAAKKTDVPSFCASSTGFNK
jgi:hypothetical protein